MAIKKLSLKHELLFFSVIVAVLPLLILYISIEKLGNTTTDLTIKELSEKTTMAASMMDQYIANQIYTSTVLADTDDLRSKEPGTLDEQCRQILERHPNIQYASVRDTNGTLMAYLGDESMHKDYTASFINTGSVLDRGDAHILEHKNGISALVITVPVIQKEKAVAYLTLIADISPLYFLVASLQDSMSHIERVSLVDSHGRILLSSAADVENTIALHTHDMGDSDHVEITSEHGEKIIVAISHLSTFGINDAIDWHLEMTIRYNMLYKPLHDARNTLILGGILIILISLVIAFYVARKVLAPIIATKQITDSLAKGDYSAEIDIGNTFYEFQTLVSSLSEMAQEVNRNEKALMAEISEKELSNKGLEDKIEIELQKSREKEQMLIQQSKMAAMGEMISIIAHQWKQPLNVMNLILQRLHLKSKAGSLTPETIEKSVQEATELVGFMSKTVTDFQNFFKPDKQQSMFDVHLPVKDMVFMLQSQLKRYSISLEQKFADTPLPICGYSNELAQVILNIINNAVDAINEQVEKKTLGTGEGLITIITGKDAEHIYITIADNGGGIPKDIQEKIFDSYFTTKAAGKGTGIGLYMTKTIINEHFDGHIDVMSDITGTRFKLLFPIRQNCPSKKERP